MNTTVTVTSFTMFGRNCKASCIIYQMSMVAVQEMFQHSASAHPRQACTDISERNTQMCLPSTCSSSTFLFCFSGRDYRIQNYPSKLPLPLHADQFRLRLAIDQKALNHRKGCRDTARGTKDCRQ